MRDPGLIAGLIILTFCSGFFSASETALFSLSSTRVRSYQKDPSSRKRLIAQLLQQPRELLVTVFMLNTLVNILLQNVASHMFGSLAGWTLKVGVPLVLTLLLGEVIPKYIGMQNNAAISYQVAPLINFLQNIIKPIRSLIVAITFPVSKIMFFYLKKDESISKEELQHVLKTSEESGVVHGEESELVWGYLNFQDAAVKEIMRPREDVLYYDINEPLTKLTHLFVDQKCTRIPTCDEEIDKVMGIMTAKEFFLHREEFKGQEDLKRYLKKPFFIPETTPARILLRRFDEQEEVIAMVVNEYGSVTGLITREDILEVVIGKISDSRDQTILYTKEGENEIIASGKLELEVFNEVFDSELSSETNLVTIGGWLIEKIGEIPKSGFKAEIQGFLFHVLAADPNRVKRMYIRKLKPKEKPIKRL